MWLQCTFAGVDKLIKDINEPKFLVTRIGTGFGPQMAEYVLGWILYSQLRIQSAVSQQAQAKWDEKAFRQRGTLAGMKVGILGAGQIGSAVAAACRAVGLVPIGLCSKPTPPGDTFERITTVLEDVLECSDILVNCLPSTASTRNLLDIELLRCCHRSNVLFINIGRGDIMTTENILLALEEGIWSRVVLDTVPVEPLPPDSPLWKHPKVNITPHISAISYPSLVAEVFADNLERYLTWIASGSENKIPLPSAMLYSVDMTKGY